jgi:hypothetical protein
VGKPKSCDDRHIMKWLLIALSLVAASAFAISVQVGMWWSVGEVTIGPFGSHHCFQADCRGSGLAWIGGSELWLRSAIATGVAGAIASFLLVVLAGAVAAKRTPRLLARVALVAVVTALACGGYFVAAFPGIDGVRVDRGLYLFAAAIVAGATACVLALRRAWEAR